MDWENENDVGILFINHVCIASYMYELNKTSKIF